MLFSEGQEWKRTRGLFSPGFALSHLMTLVPSIVDDTAIFHDKLGELADAGAVQPIEEPLARLTIDIMGHIILDHDLHSQTTENPMVRAFRSQVYWTPRPTTRAWMVMLNPVMRIAQWYYTRTMDNYIRAVIRARLAATEASKTTSSSSSTSTTTTTTKSPRRRPAIDLAVEEYHLATGAADSEFEQVAIDQMKTFLFAGHDTSSSTMCYIYHLLHLHPEALALTRAEHDRVFGPSHAAAAAITARPQLLNELPYTTAVIKGELFFFLSFSLSVFSLSLSLFACVTYSPPLYFHHITNAASLSPLSRSPSTLPTRLNSATRRARVLGDSRRGSTPYGRAHGMGKPAHNPATQRSLSPTRRIHPGAIPPQHRYWHRY
jgi:hypothetical protein